MYLPKHFEETRVEVLHELIATHPFAALVALTADGLEANHIPFELDAEPAPFGTLRGHVARANPFWRELARGNEALVIFQGPHTYVSPSWYPSKKETGKVVPTWNYAVVHAYGTPRVIEDPVWLRGLVEKLTAHHEGGRRHPWRVTDAPMEFIDKQLGAIVGVEISIGRLIGKWKVSQNRPARDRAGVVAGLLDEGGDSAATMAAWVRQYSGD
jgi:transcriptional regulator